MTEVDLNPETWSQLVTGAEAILLQTNKVAIVYVGSVAPDNADEVGFTVNNEEVFTLPYLDTLGGGVWAKAARQEAKVTFVSG